MTTNTDTTAHQAVAVAAFVQSIGINTHVDFSWSAYSDLTDVQNALAYLGVQNVRDAIDNPADLAKFAALNQDLGVKFDFFIAPGDVGMPWQLQQIESDPAIVRFVEGANESDNWPQSYDGLNGLAATVAEQQALYASIKSQLPGVPVIAPSFGDLTSYAAAGDLAAYADAANAHIYFGTGNNPGDQSWIQTIIQLAEQVAPNEPVMSTETGYYTSSDPGDPNGVDPMVQAKYLLNDVMDQFKAGVAMDYLYELADEGGDPANPEDNFGLFTDDWTAKPAAVAIHDLMLLMRDVGPVGSPATVGTLGYSLTGMQATADSLLFEKSDGTFVLAIWNDVRLTGPVTNDDVAVPNVPVTLTLASPAALIDVFDPLTGTNVIQSVENASQITLSLPDHPILIEIGPDAGPPATVSGPPAPPAAIPAAPTGLTVRVPGPQVISSRQTMTVAGVGVTDPWAAGIDGTMILNLSAESGTLSLTDANGNAVAGSGRGSISFEANIFQINTDLAHLTYTAGNGAGGDTVTVDVWDPAGLEVTQTIPVLVDPPPPPLPPPPRRPASPPPPLPVRLVLAAGASEPATPTAGAEVTIAAADAGPVITENDATVIATAGNHQISVAGTGDTISAIGGVETVMAFLGGNTITTGGGDDLIRIAGSGNVVNAGGGTNEIDDSGSGNTFVLPLAGHGTDNIYGYVMPNQDVFDLRATLAGTAWNGAAATIGDFVRVNTIDGRDATISVVPAGIGGGANSVVAVLHGSGPVSLTALLAQAVT